MISSRQRERDPSWCACFLLLRPFLWCGRRASSSSDLDAGWRIVFRMRCGDDFLLPVLCLATTPPPLRRDGGSGGGGVRLVLATDTGVCLAEAREPATMASDSESIGSWDDPVGVRRMGRDAVDGCADKNWVGRSLGVEAVDAGGSMVRMESVSSRVGVEDAETKLSFDDLESPVAGLASSSPTSALGFDSSCPSLLTMCGRLWVPGGFDADGGGSLDPPTVPRPGFDVGGFGLAFLVGAPLNSSWKFDGVVTSNRGGISGLLGFGDTISVWALLAIDGGGGGVTALSVMIALGFFPGLGFDLGLSRPAGGFASSKEDLGSGSFLG